VNRAELHDRRASCCALIGMLLLGGACLPVWWIIFDLVFHNTADGWPLRFVASGFLFAASMAAHSRSEHWAEEADAERPFSTKETLESPRWHGATTNENDN